MSDRPPVLTALIRVLVSEYGAAAVVREAEAQAGNNAPKPPRKRRTVSHGEAAKRAADLAPPDDLARARARRGR